MVHVGLRDREPLRFLAPAAYAGEIRIDPEAWEPMRLCLWQLMGVWTPQNPGPFGRDWNWFKMTTVRLPSLDGASVFSYGSCRQVWILNRFIVVS